MRIDRGSWCFVQMFVITFFVLKVFKSSKLIEAIGAMAPFGKFRCKKGVKVKSEIRVIEVGF
jgi:hypothetical protein